MIGGVDRQQIFHTKEDSVSLYDKNSVRSCN